MTLPSLKYKLVKSTTINWIHSSSPLKTNQQTLNIIKLLTFLEPEISNGWHPFSGALVKLEAGPDFSKSCGTGFPENSEGSSSVFADFHARGLPMVFFFFVFIILLFLKVSPIFTNNAFFWVEEKEREVHIYWPNKASWWNNCSFCHSWGCQRRRGRVATSARSRQHEKVAPAELDRPLAPPPHNTPRSSVFRTKTTVLFLWNYEAVPLCYLRILKTWDLLKTPWCLPLQA